MVMTIAMEMAMAMAREMAREMENGDGDHRVDTVILVWKQLENNEEFKVILLIDHCCWR